MQGGSYAQPLGSGTIVVSEDTGDGVIDYWQGVGNLTIYIQEGAAARFQIVSGSGDVSLYQNSVTSDGNIVYDVRQVWGEWDRDGDWKAQLTVGNAEADALPLIRIWQGAGRIQIEDYNPIIAEQEPQE